MKKPTLYIEHKGKVIETDARYTHVMAIALDPSSGYKKGILRCITSREGNVGIKGFTDRSELRFVTGSSLESFKIGERIPIKNEAAVIAGLTSDDRDFIGLEDPDIFIDSFTGLTHLYFTMPFIRKNIKPKESLIYLGHAVGKDLAHLEMTVPALSPEMDVHGMPGAKEISIAPINKNGVRLNLVESRIVDGEDKYSTVRIAIVEDMGKPWKFGETVFHPKEQGIPWISGHASPGPLFSREFYDAGEGKALGIINGREANTKEGGETKYGMFSVGLFIYDYEHGKIDWVSPEPFIQDTEAKTITFASQFIETSKNEGILYAHVDDSFVRTYTLTSQGVRAFVDASKS
ncbi:MAG: hypothetical protein JWO00_225 [Candidatus Parcubacteria bacterium]|nr:hypothetical protein [Candidatus Parcubacteria bacterium]